MKRNLILPGTNIIIFSVILSLIFSSSADFSVDGKTIIPNDLGGVELTELVGPRIISSSEERIDLSVTSPEPNKLLAWTLSPTDKNKIGLGDINLSGKVGFPQLPVYRILVGIPSNAVYELKIFTDPSINLDGEINISAVPRPLTILEGAEMQSTTESWLDPKVYARNAPYPDEIIKIIEEAWIRDQRVLMMEFYPFQYSPLENKVIYHPYLDAEIRLTDSGSEPTQRSVSKAAGENSGDLYEGALSRQVINYATANEWQAFPASLPLVNNFPIADGTPGLKIVVDHAGIYQISFDELVAAGMNPGGINPVYLTLLNIDSAVAYEFLGDDDNQFEAGESLRFYGEPLPAQRLEVMYQEIMAPWVSLCAPQCNIRELIENYTDENIYWLYVSETPGQRIQTLPGEPTQMYPIPEVFTDTQYAEQDIIWFPNHFTSSDVWFWNRVRSSLPATFTMPITLGVVAETGPDAVITGEIYSFYNINHHTLISLNSTLVLDSYWSGKKRYVFEQPAPLSVLQDGLNELRWETQIVSSSEYQLFDRFQIKYSRKFVAVDDRLAFNYHLPGSWQYVITGLTSNSAVVYDVTNPLLPVKIQGALVTPDGSGYRVAFEMTQTAPASLYVVGATGVEAPKSIEWYQPPELEPVNGADYVFITHHDFLAATQALADYRASQGMRTVVVDVADVYNQFNFGIYHPIAIRNYLERAMLTWPGEPPQYVLLVGDGTFEIRQSENLYVDEPNYMPPALGISDPWNGEIDVTSLLAAVIGTDIIPDLAIGRLPVKATADVVAITAKTIAHEQAMPADWQRNIVYIADDTDTAGNFINSSERLALAYTPAGFEARKFYLVKDEIVDCNPPSSCLPATSDSIISDLNSVGALMVNYTGHGSYTYWATIPTLLDRDHLSALNNADHLPVVLSWDCLDGFFYYPNVTTFPTGYLTPSLAETWLLSSGKGAVATFSPAGLGVGTGHDILASGFYDSIFKDGNWNLGAASLSAKINLYSTGLFLDLINSYSIFGDPALRISNPYRMLVSPDQINGVQAAGKTIYYKVTIQNTGLVEDSYQVSYAGNSWIVTAPQMVGPLAAGSSVTLTISVEVPFTATAGDMDQVIIAVRSNADASLVEYVELKSLVATAFQYLPVISKP